MSVSCYDRMIAIIKSMLPESERLPWFTQQDHEALDNTWKKWYFYFSHLNL